MRRVMTALSVIAMAVLAATGAFAVQQVYLDNGNSDPLVRGGPGDAVNWYSPTATIGGALWLKTGGGVPVLYPDTAGDVNVELKVQAPAPDRVDNHRHVAVEQSHRRRRYDGLWPGV